VAGAIAGVTGHKVLQQLGQLLGGARRSMSWQRYAGSGSLQVRVQRNSCDGPLLPEAETPDRVHCWLQSHRPCQYLSRALLAYTVPQQLEGGRLIGRRVVQT